MPLIPAGGNASGNGGMAAKVQLPAAVSLATSGAQIVTGSTFTLPAARLATPGQSLRFRMAAQVTGDGVATLSIGNTINGLGALVSFLLVTPPAATRQMWLEWGYILDTTGNPGSFRFSRLAVTDATSTTSGVVGVSAGGSVPLPSTIDVTYGLFVNWSITGPAIVVYDYEAWMVG